MDETIILIPTLNEAHGIGRTIREIIKEVEEAKIIVVDSDSKDGTAQIAANLGAKVLTQRTRGKGRAIAKGLRCLKNDVVWAVMIDGDYTYPARYLPKMINILEERPDVGMVVGMTCASYVKRYTLWKRIKWVYLNPHVIFHRILIILHRILNAVNIEAPLSGERVIRYECIKDFLPRSKGFDIEVEINSHIRKKAYKILEIPIEGRYRLGDKSKFAFTSAFHRFTNGLVILRRMIIEAIGGNRQLKRNENR